MPWARLCLPDSARTLPSSTPTSSCPRRSRQWSTRRLLGQRRCLPRTMSSYPNLKRQKTCLRGRARTQIQNTQGRIHKRLLPFPIVSPRGMPHTSLIPIQPERCLRRRMNTQLRLQQNTGPLHTRSKPSSLWKTRTCPRRKEHTLPTPSLPGMCPPRRTYSSRRPPRLETDPPRSSCMQQLPTERTCQLRTSCSWQRFETLSATWFQPHSSHRYRRQASTSSCRQSSQLWSMTKSLEERRFPWRSPSKMSSLHSTRTCPLGKDRT